MHSSEINDNLCFSDSVWDLRYVQIIALHRTILSVTIAWIEDNLKYEDSLIEQNYCV